MKRLVMALLLVALVGVLLVGCSDAQFREPFARCVINRAERISLETNKSLLRQAESYCFMRDSDWDRVFILEWRDSYAEEVRKIRRKRERQPSSPGANAEGDGTIDVRMTCPENDPTPDPECE